MKRLILPLALTVLAAGLPAQKQEVQALEGGQVCAKAAKELCKKYQKGLLSRPLMVSAVSRAYFPPAFASASLYASLGRKFKPGAELADKVKVMGVASAGVKAPAFQWTYSPSQKVQGVIKVYFTGVLTGRGGVQAYVKYNGKETQLSASKPGPFRKYLTIPVGLSEKVSLTYGIREAGLKSSSRMGRGSLDCRLSFYFEAQAVQPGLQWVNPKQNQNCAKGALGHEGEPAFGKAIKVTLTGATDTGKVRFPYAMLLIGNSDKRFYFFRLPLDLGRFGAKGCTLYTNIVATRVTRIDKSGNAAVPFMFPRTGGWTRWFRALYFQYAYSTTANQMGLVFTNYAAVTKK